MPSAVPWVRLRTMTSQPDAAETSAIPEPMIPDPTIPTRSMAMDEAYWPVTAAREGGRPLSPLR